MFCRQCGCELGEKDKFCFNCGTPVQPVDMTKIKRIPVPGNKAEETAEPEAWEPAAVEEKAAEPEAVAKPEPVVEPETAAEPEPEVQAEPEPVAKPVPKVQAESKPAAKPEPVVEPESVAEPEPVAPEKPEPLVESFVELDAAPEKAEPAVQSRNVEADDIAGAGIRHEAFDWNVYSFPSDTPRKTEDVEFDWGIAEGEYKRRPREYDREIAFAPEPPRHRYEDLPDDEPEITKEELFGGSVVPGITGEGEGLSKQAARIDKFYKEDKRIEEFQKLLDSEYEKFRSGRPLDQDSFVENVESIKERTGGKSRHNVSIFGGAASDMDKTAVFHRVSGLEKMPEPEAPSSEEPSVEPAELPEAEPVKTVASMLAAEETAEEAAAEKTAVPEAKPEKKRGGLFGFATRRADKNKTLEMEKEEIQQALDSVFTTKTAEETISDIFGNAEANAEKEAAQAELDEQLDRKIDDKTTEFDPEALKEKLAEAETDTVEPSEDFKFEWSTEAKAEEEAEAEEAAAAAQDEAPAAQEAAEAPVEMPAEEAEPAAAEEAEAPAAEAEEPAPAETEEAAEAAAEEKAAEPAEEATAENAEETVEDKAAETAETADEKAADTTGEKKEPSSGKGGTIAIVILSLILVALLVLIGLKFFVPGFMAENTAVPTAVAMDKTEYDGDLNGVIQTQLDKNYGEEIEVIKYDSSWKAKGMTGTEKIEDNVLFEEKDGTVRYVDETVVGTVIAYESRMQAMDQNGDLKVLDYIKDGTELRAATEAVLSTSTYEPMKSLTFGKIRQTADGDYAVWVREEKTKVTEKILTLEADGAKMKVTAEEIL